MKFCLWPYANSKQLSAMYDACLEAIDEYLSKGLYPQRESLRYAINVEYAPRRITKRQAKYLSSRLSDAMKHVCESVQVDLRIGFRNEGRLSNEKWLGVTMVILRYPQRLRSAA